MTPQQTKCLDFITKYHKENRVIPTEKVIAKEFKFSRARAGQIKTALIKLGKLKSTGRFGLYELCG
jgi:hypothetical protein